MLNWVVGMQKRIFLLFWLLIALTAHDPARAFQFRFQVRIDSPQPGEALQGVVPVRGNAVVEGFIRYELAFSFADDPSETWFAIRESREPVEDGLLAEWDTNTLSDGEYRLRLIVEIENEEPVIIIVDQLRIRNFSPIETNTPAPTAPPDPGEPATATPTTPPPTPTELPGNPAEIRPGQIRSAFVNGAVATAIALGLIGGYSFLRGRRR
jgi:hypothetical protein